MGSEGVEASVVAEGFEEMESAEGMWYFVVMRVWEERSVKWSCWRCRGVVSVEMVEWRDAHVWKKCPSEDCAGRDDTERRRDGD